MEKDGKHRDLREENPVGYEIRTINNMIGIHVDRYMKNINQDLTRTQTWVIGFLYGRQELDTYQRDIEEAFDISRATATNMLQLMEKKGLIVRRAVEHDGRLKKISLTDKSIEIQRYALKNISMTEALLVKGMSEEEIAILRRLLARVHKNLLEKIHEEQ